MTAVGKGQFHKGGGVGIRIFGTQHRGISLGAAGFAVEGEGDGIEDGGLAGTGIAGDQVKTVFTQLGKFQSGAAGVGAEGGEGQS